MASPTSGRIRSYPQRSQRFRMSFCSFGAICLAPSCDGGTTLDGALQKILVIEADGLVL